MRVHILGASGSGVTTLGRALAEQLKCPCFDCDDYFWLPTQSPYRIKRQREQRQALLQSDLTMSDAWVLSGSACGWGDVFIPLFDLVVYLWLPREVRLERLRQREHAIFGDDMLPGGVMHEAHQNFMEYAACYDDADESMRSRQLHEKWLSQLSCPVLRIETDLSVQERVQIFQRWQKVGAE